MIKNKLCAFMILSLMAGSFVVNASAGSRLLGERKQQIGQKAMSGFDRIAQERRPGQRMLGTTMVRPMIEFSSALSGANRWVYRVDSMTALGDNDWVEFNWSPDHKNFVETRFWYWDGIEFVVNDGLRFIRKNGRIDSVHALWTAVNGEPGMVEVNYYTGSSLVPDSGKLMDWVSEGLYRQEIVYKYQWDNENRLKSVEIHYYSATGLWEYAELLEYEYNGQGWLIKLEASDKDLQTASFVKYAFLVPGYNSGGFVIDLKTYEYNGLDPVLVYRGIIERDQKNRQTKWNDFEVINSNMELVWSRRVVWNDNLGEVALYEFNMNSNEDTTYRSKYALKGDFKVEPQELLVPVFPADYFERYGFELFTRLYETEILFWHKITEFDEYDWDADRREYDHYSTSYLHWTKVWEGGNVGKEDMTANGYKIFPNPALDVFQIQGMIGSAKVQILDALGRTMWSGHSSGILNVSQLKPGMYTLIIQGALPTAVPFIKD